MQRKLGDKFIKKMSSINSNKIAHIINKKPKENWSNLKDFKKMN